MSSAVQKRRPQTAQQFVLEELRRAITSGELRPGGQIRQDALAARFEVSRVPLREALKALEAEGLVVHHIHRGYFVAELSLADLEEIYRIRELLETEAVRLAVRRLPDGIVATLEGIQREVERAAEEGDVTAMAAANRLFHFTLIEASGMPRLVRLITTLWDSTDAYRALYYAEDPHRKQAVREHRAVISSLRQGDEEATVRWLDEHRAHAVAALREVLDLERD
ncbi:MULTISPECIES: GntR family transcriptional regulator [Streptomyces]|uniref:Transcriptional regulator, GntR family n=1 Tax=Streptomyces venezuelae (strain ATCC 10712 / CBS 650.69 / DSM 40230 / JCM 4526 / NBRC 13096 / PD 04745) TaxID=953739 RepID=F2R5W6_STRVP|nr:GntR family transcriptional regulator [Streptomyces venezuelae]APE19821.1 GntR family transcriptional regulator [Streptomyces venezuelae]QER97230.1 GntR family transcriptional regulator [Streptomyces venezuelae ATCC 10712]QES04421.1 GntR family transcriptional regulator [Streptomyces venezuelae]QES16838.1 GntR family transcriptional regulator [Streptomyces venezuelae]CCA53627.1 transcriptional regulator, GntR family [Streptomyces venezuelae ATCC 10712]